jgi:hypothetical protein
MGLEKIEVISEFSIDELKDRLKRVALKGFPEIRIYENAKIDILRYSKEKIKETMFTPQPNVYRKDFLDRIDKMRELFRKKGIDIFRLNGGVDYIATNNGQKSDWTLIPPVVEFIPMNFKDGGLDYNNLIGPELRNVMKEKGHEINCEVNTLKFKDYQQFHEIGKLPIICDGSHRIHSGLEKNIVQNILVIKGIKRGFPYYAAPLPYSNVQLHDERPPEGMPGKIHVLTSPGHKLLYRLFPTGGINNGVVRPE